MFDQKAILLDAGAAIAEMQGTAAWQILMQTLERMETEAGKYGLRDKAQEREWWCGYLEAVEALRVNLAAIADQAREVAAEEKIPVRIGGSLSGGGDLAI